MTIRRSSSRLVPVFALGVAVAAFAAAVFVPASAGNVRPHTYLHPMVVFTGNSSATVVKAVNNGSGFALEGDASSSAGVFGSSSTGSGLVGLSTAKFGISGTSINNIGLNGNSTNGAGMGGSTQALYPNAGAIGFSVSNSTSGSPVGVYGFEQTTGFGVVGDCVNSNVGMPASNTTCHGVLGESLATQGVGVEAFGANAAPSANYTPAPVLEVDDFNGGPLIHAFGTTGEVLTLDGGGTLTATSSSGKGVDGISTNFIGVLGTTTNDIGVVAEGSAAGAAAFATQSDAGGLQMRAFSIAHFADVMSLDDNGNMILSGTLTQSGTPLVTRRHPANDGLATATYTSTGTSPTIEDYGQAQVVGGVAHVALDPKFAQTIDSRSQYLVFLTPEGDSNGFFIHGKTLAGFSIAENRGGHSSLVVDYRIVARPIGEAGTRLAQMRIPLLASKTGPPVQPSSTIAQLARMRAARSTISQHGLGTPTQWRPLSGMRHKP